MSLSKEQKQMWKKLSEPPIDTKRLIQFSADGTKLRADGQFYNLSTPFDISTATLA